jgi:hypothetical protein
MAESLIESARMSAAVKLQRAWEREQAKSTASRKRGEEYMNQIKQDVANKNQKPTAPKEVEDESIMGFLATPKPVAKKSTTSSADMRKYFEKDKSTNPEKVERGQGGNKVQKVYTRSDEEKKMKKRILRDSKGFARSRAATTATYLSLSRPLLVSNKVHIKFYRAALTLASLFPWCFQAPKSCQKKQGQP